MPGTQSTELKARTDDGHMSTIRKSAAPLANFRTLSAKWSADRIPNMIQIDVLQIIYLWPIQPHFSSSFPTIDCKSLHSNGIGALLAAHLKCQNWKYWEHTTSLTQFVLVHCLRPTFPLTSIITWSSFGHRFPLDRVSADRYLSDWPSLTGQLHIFVIVLAKILHRSWFGSDFFLVATHNHSRGEQKVHFYWKSGAHIACDGRQWISSPQIKIISIKETDCNRNRTCYCGIERITLFFFRLHVTSCRRMWFASRTRNP